MITSRTTPLEYGEAPWKWDIPSVYQCTWWCFFRFFSVWGIYPCYQDAKTKSGSYNDANKWLENVREPAEAKGVDYIPRAGDIAVYDYGEYGHVIFMETDKMTSEYRSGRKDSFRNANFGDFKGTLLGFIHCPFEPVNTVERDTSVNQIETTDSTLRIRNKPSLDGQIIGHVQLGFYTVLNTSESDGYTWYEIAKDRWCADITTNYLPAESTDFVKQIEQWAKAMVNEVKAKDKKISELTEDMKQIGSITGKWV